MNPTLSGFIAFAQANGATAAVISPDSLFFVWSYDVAEALVNQDLCEICPPIYMLAVYNLAMSNLINYAQDGSGTDPNSTYFTALRTSFGLTSMPTGLIQSTSDEGTSASYAVPDWAKSMTIGDLQLLKDPFGRRYMAFAQEYGTAWGLTP